MKKVTLDITGMSCGHCVNKIETALKEQNGVEKAKVNVKKGTADIKYNESILTLDKITDVISEVGYSAKLVN
ncbi:copper chaperone CopZ [Paraliobacillus quinghaiensis]|uniref:Copper chaperone CopZ n=1 Tax=Paraliobacillus quinghaiensis TaxID=470815 RepID=A0A917TMS9_9BACI|nr:copper ion binding protein [Paraliobacillus quinghaiensis]GGM29557.1 copper chaperone CopZ [Paraliobacillus quinghaiensis]